MSAPERIWACMDGPMVGLFVSGGINMGWPEYARTDLLDTANARADKTEALLAEAVEALQEISRQKKTDELETEYDVEVADFEEGYDMCVDRARATLARIKEADHE